MDLLLVVVVVVGVPGGLGDRLLLAECISLRADPRVLPLGVPGFSDRRLNIAAISNEEGAEDPLCRECGIMKSKNPTVALGQYSNFPPVDLVDLLVEGVEGTLSDGSC